MDTVLIDKLQYLQIGVQGENAANDIPIDMTPWVELFPNAMFHLLFKPYNSTTAFPMVTTYDAETHILTWTATLSATITAGVGYTEIRALDGDLGLLKKSRIVPTSVENSVTGVEGGTVPAPYEDWVNQVLAYKDAALIAKTGAETAQGKAEDAQTAAETAQGKAEDAQEAAETAQEAAETAQGKAEDAQEAAEGASESAADSASLMTNATGTITQLPSGSSPTISITQSDDHMVFAFGIPVVDTPVIPDASTSQKGIVQLEDSHTSTSTSKAATPNSVKDAYDLANTANTTANSASVIASGKAAPSTAIGLTLVAGSWSSATPPTQTLTATGVTANNNVMIGYASTMTDTQYEAAGDAKILCTAQAANSLTFTCYGDEPSVNIPISVLIVG